jgi:hypothetical protein
MHLTKVISADKMKRLTIIGIALLLFSILLIYTVSLSTLNSAAVNSFFIAPHNAIAIPFTLSSSTVFSSLYYATNSTNVSSYLMNSSAFAHVEPYLASNQLLNETIKQEGAGVYQINYLNASGIFPNRDSYAKPPSYYYNGTDVFGNGTYYDVFQNSGGTNTTVHYSSGSVQLSANSPSTSHILLYMISSFMFIAGICIIGYSIIVKKDDKPKDSEAEKIEVDSLYSKFGDENPKQNSQKQSAKSADQMEADRLYAKFDTKVGKKRPKKKARKA